MDNVSRVSVGCTQARSLEKKFNWSELARESVSVDIGLTDVTFS